MSTYIVQNGDTLYGIGKQYNVSIDSIKNANNLSGNNITVGQSLTIPNTNVTTYTVVKGDSLYKIANKYNTTVQEIKTLNKLTSDNLSIGQQILIPSTTTSNDINYVNYVVKSGDNLWNLANKYNTTVFEIMKVNNLVNSNLTIGQTLRIPTNFKEEVIETLPIFVEYIVKTGDSLYKIANEFSTTVDEIKKENNLTTNNLYVGQVLKIKVGEEEETSGILECYGEDYTPPVTKYVEYIVKKGDSLYQIAKRYNTTVDNIKNLNNLTTNNLTIGQKLNIKEDV